MRGWIGQLEIGLIWSVLLVGLPVIFDRMVAAIDRFVDRLRGRPVERPRPRVVDWDDPEAKRAGSGLTGLDLFRWL
jgi:hypothetical protein